MKKEKKKNKIEEKILGGKTRQELNYLGQHRGKRRG